MFKAILISLALAVPSYGQSSQLVGATYRDFSGGLRNNIDASEISDNESPDLQNIIIDDPIGSVKPRKGYEQCGITPSGNPATELFEWHKNDGSRKLIVSDSANVWETVACLEFSSATINQAATSKFNFASVRGELWMVSRATHPIVWDSLTELVLDGASPATPIPPPPNGDYIEFWKERVWIARSNSDPSGVSFSALTDTLGNDITPSTGSAAWPAINIFQIDQEGLGPIFGIKAFRDRLYVFKEDAIWRIIFNNQFDNAVVRTLSSVGTRFNSSIVEIDGLLYFVGPDGIYAFDGDQSIRISDSIIETFESLAQPDANNLFKQWTSNDDFAAGTGVRVSTEEVTGSLLVATTIQVNSDFNIADGTFESGASFFSGGWEWVDSPNALGWKIDSSRLRVNADSGKNGQRSIAVLQPIPDFTNQNGRRYDFLFNFLGTNSAGGETCDVFFVSESTGLDARSTGFSGYAVTVRNDPGGGQFRVKKWVDGTETTLINADGNLPASADNNISVTISSVGIMELFLEDVSQGISTDTTHTATQGPMIFCGIDAGNTVKFDNFKETIYYSSETFTSDPFDAVTVSTWAAFEVTDVTNGLTRTYSWRTATTVGGLDAEAFNTIVPGNTINSINTNTVFQWRVDVVSPVLNFVEILDVTANYTQGGSASQNIYASAVNNRYRIAATSGSATANNIVIEKSKSPLNTWTKHDMQIGPMAKVTDTFYAGASTHSAIYTMETGTNDNGAAIDWYWTSRDELWEKPNNRKTLYEITTDFRRGTATNLNVSWSRDSGATYTVKTINASGTGRGSSRLRLNGGNSLQFRFRFGSSTKDESARITGITGWARTWFRRE